MPRKRILHKKPLIAISREAVQTAEDARAIAVKKMDEVRLANERQASADAQARTQGQADDAMRQKEQAESDTAKAQAATAQAESDMARAQAAKAQAESDAARARTTLLTRRPRLRRLSPIWRTARLPPQLHSRQPRQTPTNRAQTN